MRLPVMLPATAYETFSRPACMLQLRSYKAPPSRWASRPCKDRRTVRRVQPTLALAGSNGAKPTYDVVALGNLCVDVVVHLSELPPPDVALRKQLLKQLSQQAAPEDSLEVGGNCNFIVAAGRIGLRVAAVGHTAHDQLGNFLVDVLKAEAADCQVYQMAPQEPGSPMDATLVCYVLVDPASSHAFCSSYDFGPWPLLPSVTSLPKDCLQALSSSKAVFTNGFIFDELSLDVVRAGIEAAVAAGSAIFFDPGPRCFTMQEGDRKTALWTIMDLSDVILMTLEEASTVTGKLEPEAAAKWVLQRPGVRAKWCVIKLGGTGSMAVVRRPDGELETYFASAFEVSVVDTVGCGDSFAAAIVLGYLQQHSIISTLQLANAVGAATAMGRGAGRNVAAPEMVMSLLEDQPPLTAVGAAGPLDMLRMSLSED